ncbi:MAG: hypothetical protein KA371_16480 [Acidobacteria bacterium]|nr:hypothetical protein [Acidobacteriota bacterium]
MKRLLTAVADFQEIAVSIGALDDDALCLHDAHDAHALDVVGVVSKRRVGGKASGPAG